VTTGRIAELCSGSAEFAALWATQHMDVPG
jgi:hypothetical protein